MRSHSMSGTPDQVSGATLPTLLFFLIVDRFSNPTAFVGEATATSFRDTLEGDDFVSVRSWRYMSPTASKYFLGKSWTNWRRCGGRVADGNGKDWLGAEGDRRGKDCE